MFTYWVYSAKYSCIWTFLVYKLLLFKAQVVGDILHNRHDWMKMNWKMTYNQNQ